MIKKDIKKVFVLFVLLVITIQCQSMKKPKPVDVSQAVIKVDSCGIYYKNQRLDLGDDYSKWEKVLGKYDRKTDLGYVWDDKGILVDDWQGNKKGTVVAVWIFFLNLDSPEGKSGKLNHARGWKPFDESNWGADFLKEYGERLKKENDPKNFIYPLNVYKGNVNLHGFPVASGMNVSEVNAYRKDLKFTGQFGYVDQDIDGRNDSKNTTDTFGGDYRASGKECKNDRLQYYELTYTSTGALESLKIRYEADWNFEHRQRVKSRRAKEAKENKKND